MTIKRPAMAVMAAAIFAALCVPALAKETCFFKSERRDGMNKICFYRCISGDAAITIGALELCPLTIER